MPNVTAADAGPPTGHAREFLAAWDAFVPEVDAYQDKAKVSLTAGVWTSDLTQRGQALMARIDGFTASFTRARQGGAPDTEAGQ